MSDCFEGVEMSAPHVSQGSIEAKIKRERYIPPEDGSTLTICILTLENGYEVLGKSACASPENFNADLGKRLARKNAFDKIWVLEGYLLKERLHSGK